MCNIIIVITAIVIIIDDHISIPMCLHLNVAKICTKWHQNKLPNVAKLKMEEIIKVHYSKNANQSFALACALSTLPLLSNQPPRQYALNSWEHSLQFITGTAIFKYLSDQQVFWTHTFGSSKLTNKNSTTSPNKTQNSFPRWLDDRTSNGIAFSVNHSSHILQF